MTLSRKDHIKRMWEIFDIGAEYEFTLDDATKRKADVLIEFIADEFEDINDW